MTRKPILPVPSRVIHLNWLYRPFIRLMIYFSLFILILVGVLSYKIVANTSLNYQATQLVYKTSTHINADAFTTESTPILSFTSTPRSIKTFTAVPTGLKAISITSSATPYDTCVQAPKQHVTIGQVVAVTVENFDKLKLRSEPRISPGTVVKDLDKYTKLVVLDGPVCVADGTNTSYWFWKVSVVSSNEAGWVAEGDFSHYYID